MAGKAKISRGSWCLTFGMANPPSLEQVVQVLSAFGYDGIELAGFHDHATLEKYDTKESRRQLVGRCHKYNLEIVGYAPGPYGDFGRLPWATDSGEIYKEYTEFFEENLQFCVDCQIPAMRVDPGNFGPLPRQADYNEVWNRVVTSFQQHAKRAAEVGVKILWEVETGQIFVKPSEVVQMVHDVDHDNFEIMYDFGHFQALTVLGHNQVQPVETLEGGQLEMIQKLKGKIGHVHLCDSDNNTWQNAFGTHLGIGKGILDFDELIPALVECGYRSDWWSVDAIPMSSETWSDTYDDLFTLRKLLNKHVR